MSQAAVLNAVVPPPVADTSVDRHDAVPDVGHHPVAAVSLSTHTWPPFVPAGRNREMSMVKHFHQQHVSVDITRYPVHSAAQNV